MRWFQRKKAPSPPPSTISQSPSIIDLQENVEELDLVVKKIKLDLQELHFYIIGPKRLLSPKTPTNPPPSPEYANRRPHKPEAADAEETIQLFINRLTVLRPDLDELYDKIKTRCSRDVVAGEEVKNLYEYIKAIEVRYMEVWRGVDEVFAMKLGGWEVGMMRTYEKELDPLVFGVARV